MLPRNTPECHLCCVAASLERHHLTPRSTAVCWEELVVLATCLQKVSALVARSDCFEFGIYNPIARSQWTDQPVFLHTNGRKADGVLVTPLDASSRNKDKLRYHRDKYLMLDIIPASIKEPARFTTNSLDLTLIQPYRFLKLRNVDSNPTRPSKAQRTVRRFLQIRPPRPATSKKISRRYASNPLDTLSPSTI